MIKIYFGLPGCGKTTLLTSFALRALRSRKYNHVYVNVPLNLEGVTYVSDSDIGIREISDGLLLIDEGTLFADSRDYKNFEKSKVAYFCLLRHFNIDCYIFMQGWDTIDKKIRLLTNHVYYVYRPKIIGRWITRYYRIPYGIIIPDPKKSDSEKLGEIVQGYCKPHWFIRIFCPFLIRPLFYKYFDSWDRPTLPPLLGDFSLSVAKDFNKAFFSIG